MATSFRRWAAVVAVLLVVAAAAEEELKPVLMTNEQPSRPSFFDTPQRSRRATTYPFLINDGGVPGLELGGTWPNARTKRDVVGEWQRVVRLDDAVYTNEFIRHASTKAVYLGANAEENRRMIPKVANKLDKMIGFFEQTFASVLRVGVVTGWTNTAPSFVPEPLDLKYEGRELGLVIYNSSSQLVSQAEDAYRVLADLAFEAGFNFLFLQWTSSSKMVVASSVGEFCSSKTDVGFLLDGSRSVTTAGFNAQKNFVSDLLGAFKLGTANTRASIGTFDGPIISHFSTRVGTPSCPVGTEFEGSGFGCLCPLLANNVSAACTGPVVSTTQRIGCDWGFFPLNGNTSSCPRTAAEQFAYSQNPAAFPMCAKRFYFTHTCSQGCGCNPDKVALGTAWKESDSARVNMLFSQGVSDTAVTSVLNGLPFRAGATHLSLGLRFMNNVAFNTSNGLRSVVEGIPRVLITFTDGLESLGFSPQNESARILARGIRMYAVGMSADTDYIPTLRAMASSPVEHHYFTVNHPDALDTMIDSLSYDICLESEDLVIGTAKQVASFGITGIQYYRLQCPVPTQSVVLWVTDGTAAVTSVFMSTTTPNPSQHNNEVADETGAARKTLALTKPATRSSTAYATVQNTGQAGSFSVVAWAAVFVAAQLPPLDINEHPAVGTVLAAATTGADFVTLSEVSTAADQWVYSLDASLPSTASGFFSINAATGAITVSSSGLAGLDRETQGTWFLRRFAMHKVQSCLVGYQDFTVTLLDINDNRPIFTSPTSGSVGETPRDRVDLGPLRRAALGDVITTLTAVDLDSGANARFTFAFDTVNPGNADGAFALDANTGVVTVAKPELLDYETAPTRELAFRAVEEVGVQFGDPSARFVFTLTTSNVNEVPYFDEPTRQNYLTSLNVVLNELKGDEASRAAGRPRAFRTLKIKSDDLDKSQTAPAVCAVELLDSDGNTLLSSPFSARRGVDANGNLLRQPLATCELYVSAPENLAPENYTLRVTVSEFGGGDEVFLLIDAMPNNDHAPVFNNVRPVLMSIWSPTGTVVAQMDVTDADNTVPICRIEDQGNLRIGSNPQLPYMFDIQPPCTVVVKARFQDSQGSRPYQANTPGGVTFTPTVLPRLQAEITIIASDLARFQPRTATQKLTVHMRNNCFRENCETPGANQSTCCNLNDRESATVAVWGSSALSIPTSLANVDLACPPRDFFCNCTSTNPIFDPYCNQLVNHCGLAERKCLYNSRCTNFNSLPTAAAPNGLGYNCSNCPVNTSGVFCDVVLDMCSAGNNRCQNGATCTRIAARTTTPTILSHYKCTCPPGWHGYDCDLADPDPCVVLAPCRNGGTCQRTYPLLGCNPAISNCPMSNYTCTCPPGTSGRLCEVAAVCPGGCGTGTCVATGTGGVCSCPSTHSGANCEVQTNNNACTNIACLNGGTCYAFRLTYNGPLNLAACTCPPAFTGRWCHLPNNATDHCASSPCQGALSRCFEKATALTPTTPPRTTGTQQDNSFQCLCGDGRTGTTCGTSDINCRGLCQNGGTCIASATGGACRCPTVPVGSVCSTRGAFCEDLRTACNLKGICLLSTYLSATPACHCTYPYTGPTCIQTDPDPAPDACNPNPCTAAGGAGAICLRMSTTGTSRLDSYTCHCPAGRAGRNCELLDDSQGQFFCRGTSNPCMAVNGFCIEVEGPNNQGSLVANAASCVCRNNCGGATCNMCDDMCAGTCPFEGEKRGATCSDTCGNGFSCKGTQVTAATSRAGGRCDCNPISEVDAVSGQRTCYYGTTCSGLIDTCAETDVACGYVTDQQAQDLINNGGDLIGTVCLATLASPSSGNAAATVGGAAAGAAVALVALVALLLFLTAARRRRESAKAPTLEATNSAFINPTFVPPPAAGGSDGGMSNPMYFMGGTNKQDAAYQELPAPGIGGQSNPMYGMTVAGGRAAAAGTRGAPVYSMADTQTGSDPTYSMADNSGGYAELPVGHDSLSNPMYQMGAESNRGRTASYDMSSSGDRHESHSNPMYALGLPGAQERKFQVERGNIRLASVRRSNPLVAKVHDSDPEYDLPGAVYDMAQAPGAHAGFDNPLYRQGRGQHDSLSNPLYQLGPRDTQEPPVYDEAGPSKGVYDNNGVGDIGYMQLASREQRKEKEEQQADVGYLMLNELE